MQRPSDLGGSHAPSTSHLSPFDALDACSGQAFHFSQLRSAVSSIEPFPSFKNFGDIGFGPGT